MHKNVEILIGRLATDPELQRKFASTPREALQGEGLEISEIETEALEATDPQSLLAFSASLDPRIRRAGSVECQPTPTNNS